MLSEMVVASLRSTVGAGGNSILEVEGSTGAKRPRRYVSQLYIYICVCMCRVCSDDHRGSSETTFPQDALEEMVDGYQPEKIQSHLPLLHDNGRLMHDNGK